VWRGSDFNAWDLCCLNNWVARARCHLPTGLHGVQPARHLRLRYEDFVAAPTATLEHVAAFAGLESRSGLEPGTGGTPVPPTATSRGWNKLDPHLVHRIETDQADKLKEHGYAFA